MLDFFNKMPLMQQAYWYIALVSSFILLIVFVMTFFGFDTDADVDVDFDADVPDSDFHIDGGSGFQFFTFKNFVAFFTVFGWTGLSCIDSHCSTGWTLFVSILAGLIMMVITTALFFWMYKLEETGNLRIENAVGKIGEVYIPIGAKRSRMGKIHIKVQETLRELDALTDDEEELPTKTVIKVVKVISDELLLVEKYNN